MKESDFGKVADFHLASSKLHVLRAALLYLPCAVHVLVSRVLHAHPLVHHIFFTLSASVIHFDLLEKPDFSPSN